MPEDSFLETVGAVRMSRMGLATLRLDRFTCLETPDRETPGQAVTAPIEITDREVQLVINVSDVQQNRSWIEVEVLDESGDGALPGFSREDCRDMHREAVRAPVAWGESRLSDIKAGRIRLRFWLYGAARLHAFGFEKV